VAIEVCFGFPAYSVCAIELKFSHAMAHPRLRTMPRELFQSHQRTVLFAPQQQLTSSTAPRRKLS